MLVPKGWFNIQSSWNGQRGRQSLHDSDTLSTPREETPGRTVKRGPLDRSGQQVWVARACLLPGAWDTYWPIKAERQEEKGCPDCGRPRENAAVRPRKIKATWFRWDRKSIQEQVSMPLSTEEDSRWHHLWLRKQSGLRSASDLGNRPARRKLENWLHRYSLECWDI